MEINDDKFNNVFNSQVHDSLMAKLKILGLPSVSEFEKEFGEIFKELDKDN